MKVEPKDRQKAVLLVAGIVVAFAIAGWRVMSTVSANKPQPTAPPAALASNDFKPGPMGESSDALVARIELWSQAPPAVSGGNPFREVLPRGSSSSPIPPTFRSSTGMVPVMPGATFGSGTTSVDFPEVRVHGVLVDPQPNESFAVISVGGKMVYAHTGATLAEGLKVREITESGVWLSAGKERAFIEVNRSYRPNGAN